MWDSGTGDGFAGGFDDNAGGAGFFKGGSSQFDSPFGGVKQERKERSQNLVPITIAQLNQCLNSNDTFKLGALDIHMVTMVGLVKAVDHQETIVTYVIDDMSGPPIEAKYSNLKDDNGMDWDSDQKPIVENTYVRIYGMARAMQSKVNVLAFKIRPVVDLAEITCHLLESIQAKVGSTHLEKKQAGLYGVGQPNQSMGGAFTGSMSMGGSSYGNENPNGLTAQQNIVHNAIRACDDENGCSLTFLYQTVKGMKPDLIKDTVTFLNNEGHVYSTIDDEHFKSTES